jgi:hypothetical protein
MSEHTKTNDKIALLLREQTYEERMEMTAWLSNVTLDATIDKRELDSDWFASTLQLWADNQLEPQP